MDQTRKLSKLQKFILYHALIGLRSYEERAGIPPRLPVNNGDGTVLVIPPLKPSRPAGMRLTEDRILEIDLGGPKDPSDAEVSHIHCDTILLWWYGIETRSSGKVKRAKTESDKWRRHCRHRHYKSATNTIYRAFDQLEKRGLLVRRGRPGIRNERIEQLSDEGILLAADLEWAKLICWSPPRREYDVID
jgi:hypothetical protein